MHIYEVNVNNHREILLNLWEIWGGVKLAFGSSLGFSVSSICGIFRSKTNMFDCWNSANPSSGQAEIELLEVKRDAKRHLESAEERLSQEDFWLRIRELERQLRLEPSLSRILSILWWRQDFEPGVESWPYLSYCHKLVWKYCFWFPLAFPELELVNVKLIYSPNLAVSICLKSHWAPHRLLTNWHPDERHISHLAMLRLWLGFDNSGWDEWWRWGRRSSGSRVHAWLEFWPQLYFATTGVALTYDSRKLGQI